MKRLLFLVIILLMTLSIADSFAQNIHYQLDKKGELYVVPTSAVKDLQITFKSNVPDSIKRQEEILSQLRRTGKYELSSEQIRGGRYESFLLWYIPRHHKKMLISSLTSDQHMLVSYDEYEDYGNRIFNLLHCLFLLTLVVNIFIYRRPYSTTSLAVAFYIISYAVSLVAAIIIGISFSSITVGIICGILTILALVLVTFDVKQSFSSRKLAFAFWCVTLITSMILAYCYGIGIGSGLVKIVFSSLPLF